MIKFKSGFIIGLIVISTSCAKKHTAEKSIACIPADLTSNVIAFYPFSNGSLNDISGNNHHLSNSTTASSTSDRSGNTNCAYGFNNIFSSTEFLTTSNTVFLNNLEEFSISLWYQPLDTTQKCGGFESLINRGLGQKCPNRSGQWSVGLYDCRKAVFGRTSSVWDKKITNLDCQNEMIARTGIWHHLAATFKQTGIEDL